MCRLVLSNNAGPNGPASMSASKDLTALNADKELRAAVQELSHEYGGPELDTYEGESGEYRHSKIVALSDKAGKTRIVAIAD